MKDIFTATLDMIAKWPDDKFKKFRPYMEQEFDPRDFTYLIQKRRMLKEYNQTHPRIGFTNLIKRPYRHGQPPR